MSHRSEQHATKRELLLVRDQWNLVPFGNLVSERHAGRHQLGPDLLIFYALFAGGRRNGWQQFCHGIQICHGERRCRDLLRRMIV